MHPQAGVVLLVGAMHPHAGQTLLTGFNPRAHLISPVRDARILDAQLDEDKMDTTVGQVTTGRDVVPWQLSEVPPRLFLGLLTYAEVIKKSTKVAGFVPVYTRPRPDPCLIHLDNVCQQRHQCVEYQLWSLEQSYAHRVASIQFEAVILPMQTAT